MDAVQEIAAPFHRIERPDGIEMAASARLVAARPWGGRFPPRIRRDRLSPSLLATAPVLLNGSPRDGGPAEFPQPNQHGERSLQLAVEVDFISGGDFQSLAGVRRAKRLLPDSIAVLRLGNRPLVPLRPIPASPGL